MPDWTYQTIFRSPLRRLSYAASQSLVFGVLGRLGRFAAGRYVVRMMGHAQAPPQVEVTTGDWTLRSPCGLGVGVDQSAQAVSALSLFGVGLLEVGPIDARGARLTAQSDHLPNERANERPGESPNEPRKDHRSSGTRWTADAVEIDRRAAAMTVEQLCRQLDRQPFRNGVDVLAVLLIDEQTSADTAADLVARLGNRVTGFVVVFDGPVDAARLTQLCAAAPRQRWVLSIPEDVGLEDLADSVWEAVDGIRLEAEDLPSGVRRAGEFFQTPGLKIVRCGVQEPGDGLAVLEAGADIVLLDEGLPVAGPGLPKRINANVVAQQNAARQSATAAISSAPRDTPAVSIARQSWLWALLLGLALAGGGILTLVIGWTRVVLPYDEEFLGMLREEICAINPQLLPFMSHDRVTLAGTMLALGPLYCFLAFGDFRGLHWAKVAWIASAFVGFFSFFSFLGFGYFDPFHAFISVVLFQLTLFGLRSDQAPMTCVEFDLKNSPAWRLAMWGQLLMVLQGVAIFTAGVVISGYGMTSVFVAEDLEFMNTSRESLLAANPRLVPLVAHDRASFGGMLLSTGVTVFLSALWGWQRGRRWLWVALACSGSVAYGCALLVHFAVGYTSLVHLLPAYGGLAALWAALLLSRRWMWEDATVRC